MNSSNYRFSLNLHSTQSQISIPAMLGDTGRTWYVNLSDGDKIYFIEDGCLAKLTIKRPTGTYHEEFCEIRENATIVYLFDKNTCATVGLHNCEVTLYGLNGEILGSPRFAMVVSDRVIRDDDIDLSDSDRAILDSMVVEEANRRVAEEGRVSAESARAARFDDTVAGMNTRFDQTVDGMNTQLDKTIEDANRRLGVAVEEIKEEYKIPAIHIGPESPESDATFWVDTDEEDPADIDVVAKPGQIIAVKSVDKEGKPVEYKAVDLPVAPKAVTPDFAANEGEAGHILNRTHYVDEYGVIHKLPNKFIDAEWMATSEDGGAGKTVFIPEQTIANDMWRNLQSALVVGDKYAVEVNGILYECVCRSYDGTLYLGNGTLLDAGVSVQSNESFCLAWAGGAATGGFFYTDGTLEAPIGIKVSDWQNTVYNQLPEEFLPDNVVKGEGGKVAWDNVTDKPFIEGAGDPFFTHTATFATDAAAKNGVMLTGVSTSSYRDKIYWLEVNGELLKCHWESVTLGYELCDEDGNIWVTNNIAGVFVSAQTAGTYSYTLYAPTDDLMLEPQYLPPNVAKKSDIPEGGGGADIDVTAEVGQTIIVKEVDANGKPTAWESADYQPRTHWSEEGLVQVSLLPKYRSTLYSEYGFYGFVLVFNEYATESTYLTSVHSIEYDGVEYTNPATVELSGTHFCGNLYFLNQLFGASFENTGEPFLLGGTVDGTTMFTLDTQETAHTVQIYIDGTNHQRIDLCYTPKIPVIDLTPYYSNIEFQKLLTISGDDYFEKVYKVLQKNEIVRFVYRLESGNFATACGFTSRMQTSNIFVKCITSVAFGLEVNATPTAAEIKVVG